MGRMSICVTPYQLLLTILKIEDSKSELVLQEGITDKEIISNLSKERIFKKIDILNMLIFDGVKKYIINKREMAGFITRFKGVDDIYTYLISIQLEYDHCKYKYHLLL